ncbi:outer membrane lipid asymmetry maintenance protein MlaD [Thermodesulforhabdus norvegica]|uniref:Phospholipid/cholesterol/gamma-HCH transport system substrate-binding protein n=1 Tax=Thermodesulforhabdus norvegica TaxID=39841 RepID=A0A1I4QPH2_9BACT|nr:outer membrane lipid asymmetry maintenance protein MlaD [Thermodesulforhabdus norvegica]SFM41909.1 phospholipid/cholesterol/gamma-HCH transport system substrate-binding protein [Thermodesulforhabdus norvegica]
MEHVSRRLEFAVGLFLLIGLLATGYVSFRLGEVSLWNLKDYYTVYARFSNVAGLKKKAPVTIAGVEVGYVEDIVLDQGQALVKLRVKKDVRLEEDVIASIKTMGIIGDKYIAISPGGLDSYIPPGGEIVDTQPPLDIEELLGKFVFGKVKEE